MKKTIIAIAAAMMMPFALFADGYSQIWKQYERAKDKDLPKTQIQLLDQISTHALKDKSYGNLLKAEIDRLVLCSRISGDSLKPSVQRVENMARQAEKTDAALAAVYNCVLGDVYASVDNNADFTDAKNKSREFFKKALANPDVLAKTRALGYVPFVRKGIDGEIFNNDLLSIIGYKADEYRLLNKYYDKAGNRRAALVTAIDMVKNDRDNAERYVYAERKAKESKYLRQLDSLIVVYGDMPECGEVALEKYNYINSCSDVSAADKATFINYALNKWQTWRNIPRLRSEYDNLVKPSFSTMIDNTLLPNRSDSIRVTVKNLKNFKIAFTRLNLSGNTSLDPYDPAGWKKVKPLLISSSRIEINTPVAMENEYDSKVVDVALPKLKPGLYLVEMSADNSSLKIQRTIVAVSDVFVGRISLPENKVRFAVVSATTGQPLPGAKIELWKNRNDKTKTTVDTDENGFAVVKESNGGYDLVRAYTADDNYMQTTAVYGNFTNYGNKRKISNTALFTDRSVYRPGQTVHVSAVAYDVDGLHSSKAVDGKELTFSLLNANNKVVEEKKATTDDYGTAAVDFNLPQGNVMNGRFSVRCTGNSMARKSFLVEDYKRPTYEVKFDDVIAEYHNGDTVNITGSALSYAGVPVQNARVAYSVKRSRSRWFWRYSGNDDADRLMLTDTVSTDDKGRFSVRVPVVMPDGYEEKANNGNASRKYYMPLYYTFTASAQVTDNAGESHQTETSITLGTNPTALSFSVPAKTLRDSTLAVTFNRYNASGKEISGEVTYWFDSLPKKYSAKANESFTIDWTKYSDIKSGEHTLTAVCGADTASCKFVLFGMDDKLLATKTPDWAYISSETFPRDGKPVYVQVGSSCENTHIMYSVIAGNKELENGTIEVSNSLKTIPYIYKEEYGEGLLLNFLWVKDGVAYEHKYTIARPLEDKTLDLKWVTFRDKLTSGQKETWTLNISRHNANDKINNNYSKLSGGQLLAMMYDKSLDQIAKNDFSFSLGLWQNFPSTRWITNMGYSMMLSASKDIKWAPYKAYTFNTFDYDFSDLLYLSFGSNRMENAVLTTARPPLMVKGYGTVLSAKEEVRKSSDASLTENKVVIRKDFEVLANDAKEDSEAEAEAQAKSEESVQLRENLQETAFFYPALYADNNGNVNISFTLPESVTTWNFRGFAHDKDMNFGIIESEAVASKKVMVMPNVPRFVRIGDKASIAARIVNTTDKSITTTVKMQIVDPETDKQVSLQTRKIKIAANSTENAVFNFSADTEMPSLLVCRISAEGKDYSDGEQHYLPVLPDVERVVNTVPFTFLQKGEKNIKLDTLFPKDAAGKKLTVEYTANPTWLMIQALPSISEVNEKNAINLVSAYYANSLGKYIMKQSPVIKKVVDIWKKEGVSDNGSLISSLEKNQELKTLVLDETPWLLDADKESDQKKMLSTFFDESAIDYRLAAQFKSLSDLQNNDGSWSWWKGMNGSPAMTAQVLETLARLKSMTGNSQADRIMEKGMAYLGDVVVREYEEMKKLEKKGETPAICDSHAIQYLYINTLLGRKLPAGEKTVKDYLLTYLRKDRQRNIYAKALMAIVLNSDGKTQEAKEYVESIRQYTVSKPDMGRYFDTQRAGYSWFDYRIPTQTAAIEALKAVEPNDAATVNEMRLWLLQAKRTQAWDTPINSVNAIYAFIDGNYKELSADDTNDFSVAVDGKHQTLPKASVALGYNKVVYDIDRQQNLTVSKTGNGTSWGAAYAQFSQKTENISAAASGIKIEREMISGGNGNIQSLTVGDRIKVRLTITADRDYDFVQVIDKRAACMEPVRQTSGYGWGYYCVPKDNATNYYFSRLSKGRHVVETEYYVDRTGNYTTGSCSVQCAYAPEFSGRAGAETVNVVR